MPATFQSSVNYYAALFTPGDVVKNSPMKALTYNLYSNGTPNKFGHAYTIANGADANPSDNSPNAGTATVGQAESSTGIFAGILVNSKEYANYGDSGNPLDPSLALPDYSIAGLMTQGIVGVLVDNAPLVGDLVTYNPANGELSSIPPVVSFTGSIAEGGAATEDVLTVTAVARGQLQVGQPIFGPGIPGGTYIVSLGTGLGFTGTYNISTINTLTISSQAMTSNSVPAPAFEGTATCSGDTMTIASVVSGQVYIGMDVNAASGFPDGTVVTGFGTGVGGTGTYTINTSQTVTPAVTITDTANIVIPNTTILEYDINNPGNAVISLNN